MKNSRVKRLSYCEAVKLSDRPRQKGQTYTSRTLDPLIEIVSTTYYDCILYNDS